MTDSRAKPKLDAEWNDVRSILHQLWLGENRLMDGPNGIKETMEREHQFFAELNQYDFRFRRWGWRKYQKNDSWRAVAEAISIKEMRGQKWEVLINGKLQSNALVKKKISGMRKFEHTGLRLPSHIVIRSPYAARSGLLTNLPSSQVFEILNTSSSNRISLDDSTPTPSSDQWHHASPSVTTLPNNSLTERIDGVIVFETDMTVNSAHYHADASTLWTREGYAKIQHVLFAFCNNFAGINSSQVGDAMQFLLKMAENELSTMILSLKGPVRQALARSLFFGAIEIGDVAIAKLTLDELDLNLWTLMEHSHSSCFCRHEGGFELNCDAARSFPLLRAAILGHKRLFQFLLDRVKSISRIPNDAVTAYLRHVGSRQATRFKFDHQIWLILWNATDQDLFSIVDELIVVSPDSAGEAILRSRKEDFLNLMKSKHVDKMFGWLSADTLLTILAKMISFGTQPNMSPVKLSPSHRDPIRPIELAIDRRLPDVFRSLLSHTPSILEELWVNTINSYDSGRPVFVIETILAGSPKVEIMTRFLLIAIDHQKLDVAKHILDHEALQGVQVTCRAHWHSLVDTLERSIEQSDASSAQVCKPVSHKGESNLEITEALLRKQYEKVKDLLDSGVEPHEEDLKIAICQKKREMVDLLLYYLDPHITPEDPLLGGRDNMKVYGIEKYPISDSIYGKLLRERLFERFHFHEPGEKVLNCLQLISSSPGDTLCYYYFIFDSVQLALLTRDPDIIKMIFDRTVYDLNSLWHSVDLPHPINFYRSTDIVQKLLQYGCDPNYSELSYYMDDEDMRENSEIAASKICPLSYAVREQNFDAVICLVDAGADPSNCDAILRALDAENEQILSFLLEKCKVRYPQSRYYFDPCLLHAIRNNNIPLAQKILTLGEEAGRLCKYKHLYSDSPSVSRYIKRKCDDLDVDWKVSSIAPLLYAILLKDSAGISMVKALILHREINLNKPMCIFSCGYSWTALLAAVDRQNIEIIELLLEHGAEANTQSPNPYKYTPLQLATKMGAAKIVEILLEKGADVNAPPAKKSGGTALQLASARGFSSIVTTLLKYGANVDADPHSGEKGLYALEAAAKNGRLDVVKILLNAGANKTRRRRDQVTHAKELARQNGFSYICDVLDDEPSLEAVSFEFEDLLDESQMAPSGSIEWFIPQNVCGQ